MKRRILLIFTLFISVLAKADSTVGDNQMWWGYFNDSDASSLPYDGCIGYGGRCTIDAAIRVSPYEDIVRNGSIKAVRLWLGSDVSAISTSMRVWISTTCPTRSTTYCDFKQSVVRANIVGGMNEIVFDTPFEVNQQEFYVGYTITISKKAFPIMAYGQDIADGFYYRSNNGDWQDFNGKGYGRLALQLLVENESFPENCVTVNDFGQTMLSKGKRATIPVTFTNKGTNPVTSISYVVTSEDGSSTSEVTKSFSTSPMATNDTKTYNFSFTADKEPGKQVKTITVTKVNKEANNATKPSGIGYIITLGETYSVTPVVEEFTGSWCGYCPYGIVGMEKIHKAYGDRVILIAAHDSDPMAISAYSPIINKWNNGFPSAVIDRQGETFYPYNFNSNVDKALEREGLGSIKLNAKWADETQKSIEFTTGTKFAYSDDNGQFGIALILLADGLTGTGSNWAQQNYLSGQGSGGDMDYWYKAGSSIPGFAFDHVAIAAWGLETGIDDSVNPKLEAGEEQEFTYKASISTNSLVQDKTKLTAVALLIDKVTGNIVNAAQTGISDATGIRSIQFDSETPAALYYSIDGRKLPNTQKGINIIRMNDGTVKKVLVK